MKGIYQHYKGPHYEVIAIGKHTETEEEFAVYFDESGSIWLRPRKMFLEKVEGRQRFTLVEKNVPEIHSHLPVFKIIQDFIKNHK